MWANIWVQATREPTVICNVRPKETRGIMSRKKMNRKQLIVLLIFFPTLILGQLFLRQRFGLFEVSIAIGIIFTVLLWLVRDRDTASDANERAFH
jgi:hypothetical protein